MSNESALTSPLDRDMINKSYRPQFKAPILEEEEIVNAVEDLSDTQSLKTYPKLERVFLDPIIQGQVIGLFSFVPSKGAKPDEDGFFGWAKLRGCFGTEGDASDRAEYLIREKDSYHKIFHVGVGRPFPVTQSSDYTINQEEVDLRQKVKADYSEDLKKKRRDEARELEEVKDREELLMKDHQRAINDEEEDPEDVYISSRVGYAQNTWVYLEHMRKLEDIKKNIIKYKKRILRMDHDHPEFLDNYYAKYLKARDGAGLSSGTNPKGDDSFIKYMVEDAELPFLEGLEEEVLTEIRESETVVADVETVVADVETVVADVETVVADVETVVADVETVVADVVADVVEE
jgi:hypothetical protein